MTPKIAAAALLLSSVGCATDDNLDPELATAESALSDRDVATLNRIGSDVGLQYAWTPEAGGSPAVLAIDMVPTKTNVVRSATATKLLGGFESEVEVDAPGTIDPCWFAQVGAPGAPVVSVYSAGGTGAYGDAKFDVAGSNYTIEGIATPPDPARPSWNLDFVVRDAAGNVVFDSRTR